MILRVVRITLSGGLCAALVGCGAGDRLARANDELRARNVELEKQADQLRLRVQELEIALAASEVPGSMPPEEIRANMPHVAEIRIGRLSHVRDEDGDKRFDTLVLYVEPVDGRGRFTQLVGPASVNAAVIPPTADAKTVGRTTFAPGQVRDAYRSSFTGTHYTFEIPIEPIEPSPRTGDVPSLSVRVEYQDGLTGRTFAAERPIELK
jgi:hypothetical protein